MASTRKLILDLMILEDGPLSVNYISKLLGMTGSAIRTCIGRLILKDLVVRSPIRISTGENSSRYDFYVFWNTDKAKIETKGKVELLQERILHELSKGVGFTSLLISKQVGISKQSMVWHLNKLFSDGVINRKDKGIRRPVSGGITRGYIYYVGEKCTTIEAVKSKNERVFVAKQDRVTKSLTRSRAILNQAFGAPI